MKERTATEQSPQMAACHLLVRHLAGEGSTALDADPLARALKLLPRTYQLAISALRHHLVDTDDDASALVPGPVPEEEWCTPNMWTPRAPAEGV